METPGTPSQPQDSNLLHREAEGPPYGEMDLRQQDGKAGLLSGEQYKRDKSSSSSSSSSDSSDEDRHPRVPGQHGQSRGTGHPHGGCPCGAEAEHEAPGISKDELQLYRDGPGEVEPSGEARLRQRGVDSTEGDAEDSQLSRLNIKKDDEFFHFVLLCFGIGALLVSYHYYGDWFMSLGVGLLTFASLETVGIYFGLVYRIHSVLRGFLPLFQKFRQLGFRKTE
ncbi:transmembrane protein 40 isoform X1 [Heterocephalus glaber]|uniref:Transmembrane protein 40 isoform X1 n=1 Tax=Heterocephalus glaber TaxID=10181 RepID=A0AAX6QCM3_HETGA|nr:transmembrane protein 40 isoform X1 [Heterocephalus glaber]